MSNRDKPRQDLTDSARDFLARADSFRRYMSETRWDGAQRRNGFKALALAYLQIQGLGPEGAAQMARIFSGLCAEYMARMRWLGFGI